MEKKKKIPFWLLKLNPITMWKRVTIKDHGKAPIEEKLQKDQASIFKPKGFR